MKERIEKIINKLEKDYDFYLEKTEDIDYIGQWRYFEEKLHDLRIEINTYKNILEMFDEGSDK